MRSWANQPGFCPTSSEKAQAASFYSRVAPDWGWKEGRAEDKTWGKQRRDNKVKTEETGSCQLLYLCSPSWSQTHCVVEGALEFLPVPLASTSQGWDYGYIPPPHSVEAHCWGWNLRLFMLGKYSTNWGLLWRSECLKGEVNVLLPTGLVCTTKCFLSPVMHSFNAL